MKKLFAVIFILLLFICNCSKKDTPLEASSGTNGTAGSTGEKGETGATGATGPAGAGTRTVYSGTLNSHISLAINDSKININDIPLIFVYFKNGNMNNAYFSGSCYIFEGYLTITNGWTNTIDYRVVIIK